MAKVAGRFGLPHPPVSDFGRQCAPNLASPAAAGAYPWIIPIHQMCLMSSIGSIFHETNKFSWSTFQTRGRDTAMRRDQATFWVSFFNIEAPSARRFLGAAIIDMDRRASAAAIIRRAWQLGANPGGAISISEIDARNALKIARRHKNRLITDQALLMRLGSVRRRHFDS